MCILGSSLLFLAEIVEIDVADAGTKNERNLLFALQLCFLHLLHLFAFCWHTGDNVRLSDVVKFFKHEFCVETGDVVSLPAWPHCATLFYPFISFLKPDIDECAADTCQNGATCVNSYGGYRCECQQGFTGTNCERRTLFWYTFCCFC